MCDRTFMPTGLDQLRRIMQRDFQVRSPGEEAAAAAASSAELPSPPSAPGRASGARANIRRKRFAVAAAVDEGKKKEEGDE